MTTGTPAAEAIVLTMLRKGRGIDFIAAQSGWTESDLRDLAATHQLAVVPTDTAAAPPSIPERGRLRRDDEIRLPPRTTVTETRPPMTATATTPPPERPGSDRVLDRRIQEALAHPSKTVQMAGRRVQAALDRLNNVIHEDEAKHAAKRRAKEQREAERARKQREKEAARAEVQRLQEQLRAARAKLRAPKKATAAKPAAATSNGAGPKAADGRAWARENGVDCPDFGRLPAAVLDQYAAAHQS